MHCSGRPLPDVRRVVELACVALCWLFSSPNRYQRDWVTKALVQLLHGHLDVARAMLDRFCQVDDPYVVQRLVAVPHAAMLRSPSDDRDAAGRLAARCLSWSSLDRCGPTSCCSTPR